MNRSRRRTILFPRFLQLGLLVAALGLAGAASAHATLVIGELTVAPDPPAPDSTVTVTVSLIDPLLVPVEKALVRIELREIDPEDPAVPPSITGTEAVEFLALPAVLATDYLPEIDKGVYSGSFVAPEQGRYTISVRDTTFRNEEAIANIGLDFGMARNGEVAFVLPPTPIGPRSLGTWLLWIIGIPVAAGLLVTVLVLRRGADQDEATEGGDAADD